MQKVTIKSTRTEAKLEFSEIKNEYFTVEFSSASLTALHQVWLYTGDGERLAQLFLEMAKNWTGWEGEKTWNAIEDDFSLACSSDKLGHVTLRANLVNRDSELWSTEFTIEVEAGQLERIANEMRRLLQEC